MYILSLLKLIKESIQKSFPDNDFRCKECSTEYTLIKRDILGEELMVPKANCKCAERKIKAEEQEEERKRERRILENYDFLINYNKNYGIEEMIKNLDSKQVDIANKLKKYREDFLGGEKRSVYFYGTQGTGKTSFIKRLACWFEKNGIRLLMVDTQKLLSSYKKSYSKNELPYYATEYGIDNLITGIPLLILDDVGVEKPSEWSISKFMFIFNERNEVSKPTIITSNYSPEELVYRFKQAVGEVEARRLVGRMIQNSLKVDMKTKDYRFC